MQKELIQLHLLYLTKSKQPASPKLANKQASKHNLQPADPSMKNSTTIQPEREKQR